MLSYSETIDVDGIAVPYDPQIITSRIERPMRRGGYERGARLFLRDILQPDDRLLDLGAGTGLVAAFAARLIAPSAIMAVEPSARMIPMITELLRLNDAEGVRVVRSGVGAGGERTGTLYNRADFWSSSMVSGDRPYVETEEVPVVGLQALIEAHGPTVIYCDAEGAEADIFDSVDLSGVRHLVIDTHDKIYGQEGVEALVSALEAMGFERQAWRREISLLRFDRIAAPVTPVEMPQTNEPAPEPAPPALLVRELSPPTLGEGFDSVPERVAPESARIFLPTCMKDEGPFILEWLAWHLAAGITDIVVFSNDCTDGTDLLLDHLDKRGFLTHLSNPASLFGSTLFQPAALAYAEQMAAFRNADYVISMDVDEFINVKRGDGTVHDLLGAVAPFDALSMFELNHGSNMKEHYERGWLKDLFPGHQSMAPGRQKAHRGVKTIVRRSPRLQRLRNHRSDFYAEAPGLVWLNGSGQQISAFQDDPEANGADCRGGYDLVTLDHFALRSLDSYLIKMFRGDVVSAGKQVSQRYWRLRNGSEDRGSDFDRLTPAAKAFYAEKFETDDQLMALHDACCRVHEERIAYLRTLPEYQIRIDWIKAECWDGD